MNDKTFYDIHMHAFNLSHPSLLAFIQRLKIHRYLILNSFLGPLASFFIGANFNKVKNLLAVMENDIGSCFLMLEEFLKKGDEKEIKTDGVFVEIGKVPSTGFMKDIGIDMDERGYIIADEHQRTNIPGILAAGDATTSNVKQVCIAVAQGSVAALEALDYIREGE